MNPESVYLTLGVSREVFRFGEEIALLRVASRAGVFGVAFMLAGRFDDLGYLPVVALRVLVVGYEFDVAVGAVIYRISALGAGGGVYRLVLPVMPLGSLDGLVVDYPAAGAVPRPVAGEGAGDVDIRVLFP